MTLKFLLNIQSYFPNSRAESYKYILYLIGPLIHLVYTDTDFLELH